MILNKFFKLIFFLFFYNQAIFCDQESSTFAFHAMADIWPEMQYVTFHNDEAMSENQYCGDGFLQGTLVNTINGYVPIEQIEVGDIVVGIEGAQEVLSVKKGKIDRYVRLLIDDQPVCTAMHQQLYLVHDKFYSAAGLIPGFQLQNGQYILENEIIDEPCTCYSLTTEHHAFFIYPDILVHNYNLAAVGALGSFIIGAVEVSNPVTVILGIIAPLSWYAVQYFRSNIVYNYEFEEKDINLPVQQLCLQNNEVVQKSREYYDIKRRALHSLYQDLAKIKNDIIIFSRQNYNNSCAFSFNFLSAIQPSSYTLTTLPGLPQECALSVANKEKLMQLRDVEIEKLQQDVFDMHLSIAFHFNELIDRRNQAQQLLFDIIPEVNIFVDHWQQVRSKISPDTVLAHYKINFIWCELLNNLEWKTNEVKCIISYYQTIKNHFFVQKTTNLIDLFENQIACNQCNFNDIQKGRASWFAHMKIIEDYLKIKKIIPTQLIVQYTKAAEQYVATKNYNIDFFAQKKKDNMKKQIDKESDDAKKGGGGGGPEDPENDPRTIFGFFIAAFTHIFQNKEGHFLLDTLENRTLLLDMAKNIKNYAGYTIERTGIIKYWYGRVLPDGRQLWVWAKDGLIRDGGINKIPRPFDPDTGYCFNPFKK